MRVLLIRHGMTEGNALRRYIGSTDQPLSPLGEARARRAGGSKALERVVVSPLIRTRQTASILFPNAKQRIVEGLCEMDFGAFENRSARDMENDPVYRAWVDAGCVDACPGGEALSAFIERCCAAFEAELALMKDDEGIQVFVLHGGVITAVMSRYAQPHKGFYEWGFLDNCHAVRATVAPSNAAGLPFALTDAEILDRIEL